MLSAAAKWAASVLKTPVSTVANATSNQRHVFHKVNDHVQRRTHN